MWRMPLDFLPDLQFLTSSAALEACTENVGSEKGLKNRRIYSFVNLGLFPVSEGHKLVQNFLQSLEPPFVVGGCPSISPVHMRAVRFTNLGYFFPKFLDAL